MKILENEKLGMTSAQAKAWPFWSYGYGGTDGTDWRTHQTADGFQSIPDYAEEAWPLSVKQAYDYGLMPISVSLESHLPGGGMRYKVACHEGRTVRQAIQHLTGTYVNSEGLAVLLDGCPDEFHNVIEIPEAFLRLQPAGVRMTLRDGKMRIDVKLFAP